MGTWGTGVFDNDTACDLAGRIAKTSDLSVIEPLLDPARLGKAPDIKVAFEMLAAADAVARLQGEFGQQDAHTAELDKWAGRHHLQLGVSPELARQARAAVDAVLARMHFLALAWADARDYRRWLNSIDALRQRIWVAPEIDGDDDLPAGAAALTHEGFAANRLHPDAGNPCEVAFAEAWQEENRACETARYLIPGCTERDARIAATVMQWLGSAAGLGFLGRVITHNVDIRKALLDGAPPINTPERCV